MVSVSLKIFPCSQVRGPVLTESRVCWLLFENWRAVWIVRVGAGCVLNDSSYKHTIKRPISSATEQRSDRQSIESTYENCSLVSRRLEEGGRVLDRPEGLVCLDLESCLGPLLVRPGGQGAQPLAAEASIGQLERTVSDHGGNDARQGRRTSEEVTADHHDVERLWEGTWRSGGGGG